MMSGLTPSTIKNFYLAGCKVRTTWAGTQHLGDPQEHTDSGISAPRNLSDGTNLTVPTFYFAK